MITQHLPVLQVIVPLLTAPLCLLAQDRRFALGASLAASGTAFLIAALLLAQTLEQGIISYELGGWSTPWGIEYRVDTVNAFVLLIVTAISSAVLVFAQRSVAREILSTRIPVFYTVYMLCLAGLLGIAVTGDVFNLFVFMEISALSSYTLIALSEQRRALTAAYQYLFMGTIGATFYLIGVGLIYMMTGTLNLADMEFRIHEVADQRPILAAAGFITVGLALKAAIFPLHVWLPNAYTYAPHMVTAFLAACSTKVSLYVLLRFDFFVFQGNLVNHDAQFTWFLMPLAVLAILIASGVALFEQNIKRLLAYSSIAQIGYILLGASFVTLAGLTASTVHLFNHALAKGALFLAVGCLATQVAGMRLSDLGGVAKRMPWTAAALIVAGFSLIGVPGTAGFISKWYLITAALEQGSLGIALVAVLVISSLMAVVYIWRIVEAMDSLVNVGNFQGALQGIATTTLRAVAGDMMLDDVLSKRDQPPRLYGVPLDLALWQSEVEAEFLAEVPGFRPPTRSDILRSFGRGQWVSQPTGMDISPDGRLAAVITYRSLYVFRREGDESWPDAMQRPPQEFVGPPGLHDEAVGFSADGRSLFVFSERRPSPFYRLDLPQDLL